MFHYVYAVTNEIGEFYIGCRSSTRPPQKDRYFGSGAWIVFGARPRVKAILSEHPTRRMALLRETTVLRMVISSPLCRNRRITNWRLAR